MPWLISLATGWGLPSWASKLFGIVAPVALIGAALWGTYSLIHHAGETAGAAKVTAKAEKQHAAAVKDAQTDERSAQAVTDAIGASVTRSDEKTTELVRSTIEDMHNAIDAVPPAVAGAPLPPAPVDGMRDKLNTLIDGAERAAQAADAEP
jgi:hypothetical protein